MKKLLGAAAFAVAIAGGASADDDTVRSETLDLVGFDRIKIAGVYELDVRVGDDFSITLTGPAYEMDRVEASVENGALVLDQRRKNRNMRNRNTRDGVEAVITMPSLTALNVSGVVDGSVAGVDADNFDLNVSGVGDINIDGECGVLDAKVSGVGDLNARNLECREAEIRVSGVGSASVFASDEIDAKISGMGDIDVYGSPEQVRKNSGMFAEITVH
ncbi:MAG: head GIN domain-containing protein [Pseudomonadota bacterium]